MNYALLVGALTFFLQSATNSEDSAAILERKLKTAEWKWPQHPINLLWCIQTEANGYEIQISWMQNRSREGMQVRLLRDGKEVCTFSDFPNTVLVRNRKENVLYVTDFHYLRPGCSILAFDLTAGKLIWKTTLEALKVTGHYSYNNEVNIVLEGNFLYVYGKETAGRYIELIDCKTGKTVGNKKLPKDQ